MLYLGLTAAVACGAVGCGGDEASTADEPRYEAASEPSKEFAARMANLMKTTTKSSECLELNGIIGRSLTRFSCPPSKALAKSMASFEIVRAEEYGTGAVVDYRSGEAKEGAAIILFVAPNREWGISRFGVITEPSVGTSDEGSRDGYDAAVDDYLTAVRERDCKAYMDVAATASSDPKAVCGTAFADTKDLAQRLKASSSAKPEYQGGNRTYGFYAIETASPEPENTTISVLKTNDQGNDKYVVMDIAPSPTAAALRRLQREFERQRKQGNPNPNSMLPGEGEGTGRKVD